MKQEIFGFLLFIFLGIVFWSPAGAMNSVQGLNIETPAITSISSTPVNYEGIVQAPVAGGKTVGSTIENVKEAVSETDEAVSAVSPTFKSVSPNIGYNTQNLKVTITGTNFSKKCTVKFSRGSVVKSASSVNWISSNKITCNLPLKGVSSGSWTLIVRNSDGKQVKKNFAFTVLNTIPISSSSFSSGGAIPKKYTRLGADLSPPLKWGPVPAGTKSFVLICEDPDGGDWTHWIAYNIPITRKSFSEGVSKVKTLTDGTKQGKNDFGYIGYGGPQPPSGKHRYYFRIYAMNVQKLSVADGASRSSINTAMSGHILKSGYYMGTYTYGS